MYPWTKAELAEITGGTWEGDLPDNWTTDCIAFWNMLIGHGALVIPHVSTFGYGVDTPKIARFREQGIALLADADFKAPDDLPLLRVSSVLVAMRELAERARAGYRGRLVAISGSVGKTSTTRMINTILRETGHSPLIGWNFNTLSGVAGQIANLPPDGIHAVEVAISYLRSQHEAVVLKPDVALITTIGDAHLKEFGSRNGIAEVKSRLYEVADGGTSIVPRDSEQFDYLRDRALSFGAKILSFGEHAEADFRLLDYLPASQLVRAVLKGQEFNYKLGIQGRHMAVNSLGALAVAGALGLDLGAATDALRKAEAIPGRGRVIRIALASGHAEIVDETYNANPTSVAAVLATFAQGQRINGGRMLALLGDMRELGPRSAELHAGLAKPILAANLDKVLTLGKQMRHLRRALPTQLLGPHYSTADEVLPDLINRLQPGDRLLVKASNATNLHEVVARIYRQLGERGEKRPRLRSA